MIVCPRCSKENQDHYKFCLGCGSELPRDAVQAPKDFSTQTPPGGVPAVDPSQVQQDEATAPTGEKPMEFARTQVRGSEPETTAATREVR